MVNTWKAHFDQAGVTNRDIQSLAERIEGEELLSQRMSFDPAKYSAPPSRRKGPGSFRDR